MADRTNPDGTVRIVSDRRLLRRGPIDPVVVEVYELFAPWQEEADRNGRERVALAVAQHEAATYRPWRTARWVRPAAAAD